MKKVEAVTMAYDPYEPRKTEDLGREAREKGRKISDQARQMTQTVRESGRQMTQNLRERAHDIKERAGERLSDASHYVRDRTSDISRQVQNTTRQTKDWVTESFDEYPLAFGGACVILGMAAGFLIPTSRPERRIVGNAGRQLMEQAQAVGAQLIDRGEEVAERAVETVRGSIKGKTGSPGGQGSQGKGK
jgi:ElaB/YqjD/DUF883 family membrane-anchored ribosome-binding protein